jgi:hypothetical protein
MGQPLVRSVAAPGAALEVKLETQVGQPYDTRAVSRDVHYLWSLGRFEDVRVEAEERSELGVAVVFRATPRRFFTIRRAMSEPNTFGLEVAWLEGSRVDRRRAHDVALQAQRHLQESGFPNARVTHELLPAAHGSVDLKLRIEPGKRLRVRRVEFAGAPALPPAELQRALRALRRKRIFPGWRGHPPYTQSALDADLARLRSYYFFKGYFDSTVQAGGVESTETGALVTIEVNAGKQQQPVPGSFCAGMFAGRREAERSGVLETAAIAEIDSAGQLLWTTEKGPAYRVGRIELAGNRRYSDSFVRRNFFLDEGDRLDSHQLRQSIARLNRTGAFDPLDERTVSILPNPEGIADIHIRLAERRRGAWNISGPLGPGPLQAAIGIRLPGLAAYTASLSMFPFARPVVRWLPVFAVQCPYTPGEGWRSGFTIAPQLGWRWMVTGYLTTQLEQRLLPILRGDSALVPELPVTVRRPAGEETIICEPPAPRLAAVRRGAVIMVQVFGTLSGM